MKQLLTVLFYALSFNIYAQVGQPNNDTIPPPPPPPYLIVDRGSSVQFAKEYGFELIDIKTYSCGQVSNRQFVESISGDTLTVSFYSTMNCCIELVGRISSDWGETLELEMYPIGNDFCTCNCNFRFDYIIKLANKSLLDIEQYFIFGTGTEKRKITGI